MRLPFYFPFQRSFWQSLWRSGHGSWAVGGRVACLNPILQCLRQSVQPKPQTPDPKPPSPNPKTPSPNPKTPSPNPKPKPQNPKPKPLNPKPLNPNTLSSSVRRLWPMQPPLQKRWRPQGPRVNPLLHGGGFRRGTLLGGPCKGSPSCLGYKRDTPPDSGKQPNVQ